MEKESQNEVNVLDYYRIALDFGLPAAEKAIALIDRTLQPSANAIPLTDIPAND